MEKECGICHGHCTDPEVLPCDHSYCKQCIRGPALRAGIIKPFPCPECGRDTILPTAFFVECMKEREFQEDQSIVKESSLQECKKHMKKLKAYCYQCQHLICNHCINKDCHDHRQRFEYLTVAVPEEKRKFKEQLEPLKREIMEGLQALEELQATRFEMEDQGCSVANRIEKSFEELFKVLQNHKQELLREASSQVSRKLKRISDQEKSLSTKIASLQRAVDYAERCVDHLAGKAFMDMRLKIQDGLDSVKGNVEVGKTVEPVEEVDIGVELIPAKDLKLFCQTNSKIAPLPVDATKCVVTGEGVKSAEVNIMSEFRVFAKLSNGKLAKKTCSIQSNLKSLSPKANSNTECQVDGIQGGEYRIQYTPTVRGRHELIVTVNGQEVAGSPFPVFVSIHPTQLGEPVHTITGLTRPWYLDVTPAGNIIVVGSDTVTVLDKNGKKLKSLKTSVFGIDYHYGVAVDSTDDSIYITGGYNGIAKLSPDLKLIYKYERDRYGGVTVVGDEVMVCTESNGVKVFTKDLKYVRQICSLGSGSGQFHFIRDDISSDEHGNVYISDTTKDCVQVYSNGGEFIRTIGADRLKSLHGVAVSGHYVFITCTCTDDRGHPVSVFTTDGEYVASVGRRHVHNDNSHTMCVDKDGFVYICNITEKIAYIVQVF